MSTVKLYDLDSYTSEFSAKVLASKENGKGQYEILLDRTAFFPEGGGQTSDTGFIENAEITDVQIRSGEIFHTSSAPFPAGAEVKCRINFDERFRKMQNHSGEHIVSGLIHKHFGFENVGFRLGSQDVTMDYNGVLSREQLLMIEKEANRAVAENIPIKTEYPSFEALSGISYRSKLELTENVRIVTIEGYDVCACCAPHVRRTGSIGIIKILDFIHYKGGIRVHMHCGFDALDDYNERYANTAAIASALSVKQSECAEAVNHLLADLAAEKYRYNGLCRRFIASEMAALPNKEGNITFYLDDCDTDTLRAAANLGREKCTGVCVCLSGNDKDGYRYVITSQNVKLKSYVKENIRLPGGGGGSDEMLSGLFRAPREAIDTAFGI